MAFGKGSQTRTHFGLGGINALPPGDFDPLAGLQVLVVLEEVLERTFTSHGGMALLRRVTLKNWPPRHTMAETEVARLDATLPPPDMRHEDAFESSDVSEQENHALPASVPIRKTRARSLIKSSKVRPLKV